MNRREVIAGAAIATVLASTAALGRTAAASNTYLYEHDVIAGAPAFGQMHGITGRLVAPR